MLYQSPDPRVGSVFLLFSLCSPLLNCHDHVINYHNGVIYCHCFAIIVFVFVITLSLIIILCHIFHS